jgi:hypothetical protein
MADALRRADRVNDPGAPAKGNPAKGGKPNSREDRP